MYCKFCGSELRESARFCSSCGREVRPREQTQGETAADTQGTPVPVQGPPEPTTERFHATGADETQPHSDRTPAKDPTGQATTSDPSASSQKTKGKSAIVVCVIALLAVCIAIVGTGQRNGSTGGSGSQPGLFEVGSNFSIEGKWKNVGADTYGQIQSGSIVVFDGTNCNVVSPSDTYALTKSGGGYQLDCTTMLFSETLSFTVKVIDNDHIELIKGGGTDIQLERVG